MPILTAAVICVGALCIVDLVLTLGVIRRLREHTKLLSVGYGASPALGALAVGATVDAFSATTVTGDAIDGDRLGDDTLIAFFSPTCAPCADLLPKFVGHAVSSGQDRDAVLAVVVGDPGEAAKYLSELQPVAHVVTEPSDGPLSTTFQVTAFPTVLRLRRASDGRLVVADNDVTLQAPALVGS
jgi:hypothetical protein